MTNVPSSIVPPPLGRQPALDGIRGIAILSVLVFHFGWKWLPGGFLGVDVFFALSGFLITTLLLEDQLQFGVISLKRFFLRRAIRLYPALVALVAVSTVFTLYFHRTTSLGRVFTIAEGVLLYDANWLTYADSSGWFGGMPHTWSLAVEAQFYLLWSVIITVVSRHYAAASERKTMTRMLILVASMIWVGSSAWRAILWSQDAEWLRTYLGTDTRLDGVFLGSTAALLRLLWLQHPRRAWLMRVSRPTTALVELASLGVLVFLFATLNFGQSHCGLIGFTAAGAATSVLILTSVLRPDSILGPVFRLPMLTWIGRISYSIYIWHVPAEKLIRTESLLAHGFSPLAAEAMRVVVTLLLGAASYYGIERTFLKLQNHFRPQGRDGSHSTILLNPTT